MVMINVVDVAGVPECIASADGNKVFEKINKALNKGSKVQLSFKGVKILTTAFLNTAVGKLYGTFSAEQIEDGLSISDLDAYNTSLLKRVESTAKLFYSDGREDRMQKSILEIQDEN